MSEDYVTVVFELGDETVEHQVPWDTVEDLIMFHIQGKHPNETGKFYEFEFTYDGD